MPSSNQQQIINCQNRYFLWVRKTSQDKHPLPKRLQNVSHKIDELRAIAKKSRAAVIGITESKLDESVTDGEINIDGYEVI